MSMFDNIIKQKADSHEAPVPPGAWDNIIKKEKKRRFGFFWWTAAVLLCALLVIGYYRYNPGSGIVNRESAINKPSRQLQNQTVVGSNNNTQKTVVTNESGNRESAIGNRQSANEKPGRRLQIPTAVDQNNNTVSTNDDKPGRQLQTPPAVGSNKDMQNLATNENGNRQSANEKPGRRLQTPTTVGLNKDMQNLATNEIGNWQSANEKPGRRLHTPTVVVVNNKKKSAIKNEKANRQNKTETVSTDNSDGLFAKKNNSVKNDKGRSALKIEPGETGNDGLNENKNSKKDMEDVAVNDPVKNNDEQKILDDNKKTNPQPPPLKKELVVDSAKKTVAATTPVENKKEKNAVNKPAKKHAWFIDAGVSPVLPIQQYDKAATFTRKQVMPNDVTVFSGKLTGTSMDAAVAYSIAVRRELGKKLSVGLGLQYLKLNEQITISGTEVNTKYTIVDRLVDNVNGPQLISDTIAAVTEGNRKIAATNSYTFLSIPVFVQYNFIQKQSWSLGVVAGVYINVYGKYTNEINRNHDAQLTAATQSINEKSSIGASLYGGFRFGKRISKRLELFGTPSVTWALGRQNIKNSLLNKKIQQAGLNIGLSYKLN